MGLVLDDPQKIDKTDYKGSVWYSEADISKANFENTVGGKLKLPGKDFAGIGFQNFPETYNDKGANIETRPKNAAVNYIIKWK